MNNNVYQKCIWVKNPDLDKLMTFDHSPVGIFEPAVWDTNYQHIWYIDPKFNPLPDKIWAVSCYIEDHDITGTKDMGYLSPSVHVEFNDHLPKLNFDMDQCYPPFWEASYVCAYELNPIHHTGQRLWVVKTSPTYRKPKAWIWQGIISPEFKIEYNKDISNLKYDLDYVVPWHDLEYENVWMLDQTHLSSIKDKVWAIKISATDSPIGQKEIGLVVPDIPDKLDVVFISYNEPNAEQNWQRVLEKAPWAKRVNGVKGIFEAHKAAAELATTDMFYVVDGDAWLIDEWEFNYQPNIFDRNCTHIWRAKNPINGLIYGYGGVKLFPTDIVRNALEWNSLDLSTSIVKNVKIMDMLSNITAFDTDAKSVWRSAFRECVKLCYNVLQNPKDISSQARLQTWLLNRNNHIFKKNASDAAEYAIKWTTKNKNDYASLKLINSRQWTEEQFNKYESRK